MGHINLFGRERYLFGREGFFAANLGIYYEIQCLFIQKNYCKSKKNCKMFSKNRKSV